MEWELLYFPVSPYWLGSFVQLLTTSIASMLMWIQFNKVKYIRLSPFYEISMITISFARCKVVYGPCSKVLMRNNSNGSNDNAMKYELLYLALQVVLMHCVPFVTNKNSVHNVLDDCVFEWKKCLLKSLLGVVILKP